MDERSDLVVVFMAELATGDANAEPTLERELRDACTRGRSAFPQIALDDLTFIRHLGRAIKRDPAGDAGLSKLAIEDLFLACGCAEGNAPAADLLRARARATVSESMRGIVQPADAEDVREQFLQDLLVGGPGSPAKIASYSGRASLDKWLGVAARRAALMWLRKNRTERRVHRAMVVDPAANEDLGLESAYIKEHYRAAFEQALGEALGRLPERDRIVLRLCLVNGVSLEKIGTMFKVSQSTVSRWLGAARGALLDDVKEMLRVRLGATSSAELASLARMVASRLDLTLPRLLGGS